MSVGQSPIGRIARSAGVGMTALALLGVGSMPAWAGDDVGLDPTMGGGRSPAASGSEVGGTEQSPVTAVPVLTAAQQQTYDRKDAAAKQAASGMKAAAVSHKSIKDIKQVSQDRTYWCGPATLVSLVQADGDKISQGTAADRLHTNSSGTAWYTGSYPMEKALEHYITKWEYVPKNLPYSPTRAQKRDYRNHLKLDVNSDWGIAGNALEVKGGPHLNHHPSSKTIYHWVAIRGYDDSGATTRYADPVEGSDVSWAAGVDDYNEISSDKIVTIMGDRGYIW